MQVLRKTNVVTLSKVTTTEALEFINCFMKLEISRVFSLVSIPCIETSNTGVPQGLFDVQFTPMGATDAIDDVYLEIFSASVTDGMLSKWADRVEIKRPILTH